MIDLSIIVPVYKKEDIIALCLQGIVSHLELTALNYEVVVVIDGYSSVTTEKIQELNLPQVKILVNKDNQGKGAALKKGIEFSRGRYVGYMDAGLDICPEIILTAANSLDRGFDIIYADRYLFESKYTAGRWRKVISATFQVLARVLFETSVRDTQVGFKIFDGALIRQILPEIEEKKWLFDLEAILLCGLKKKLKTAAIPVEINMSNVLETSESVKFEAMLVTLTALFHLSFRVGRLGKFNPTVKSRNFHAEFPSSST